jgi:HD-GYP domain-containing protein (c-di-GMP phosphodiesterase class II)
VVERRTLAFPDLNQSEPLHFQRQLAGEGFQAYFAVPLVAKGQSKGVLEVFNRRPLEPEPDWLEFLETLAGQAAIALDNSSLFENLQRSNVELAMAYDATIEGWSWALDLRDKETEGHTERVTDLTLLLAATMGFSKEELVYIRRGALLHDIGKMGISDNILLKPGSLAPDEWKTMQMHPVYAYELLSPIAYLRPSLDIPYCHHERWDGTGYPRQLRGVEIPLSARIFSVVDVWDALRSDRPYRAAWSEEEVCNYLLKQKGKHFEPELVDLFLDFLRRQNKCKS